jgi:dipeptide/tripeptide permease
MVLGHPKGLFPLFFTEMWERLAFYTMVGILLLYTTDSERGGLGLPSAEGNEIYGLYLAFVYFTPFLGGMIADRFLGYRKAVFLGGLLMAGGLILMSVPGYSLFVLGLISLIIGNGFFKPNISVMVGNLYEQGDEKRDAGFNIFYMGINIGALAATLLVAPIVRNSYGWLWTFRAAGFGVLIAVVILILHWRILARADRQPERDPQDTSFGAVVLKILLPAFLAGIAGYLIAKHFLPEGIALRPAICGFLAGMVPVLIFFVRMGVKAKEDERPGLLALLPIYVAGACFFMILHLNGSAMTQWARDDTNREAAGVGKVLTGALPSVQQDALPLYYINAPENVPRPDPRGLVVVDDETARMFGQQRMSEGSLARLKSFPDIEQVTIDESDTGMNAWALRSSSIFPDDAVEIEETVNSHGEKTISVSVREGARATRKVAFVKEIEGKRIAVFLVDANTYAEIYRDYKKKFGKNPEYLPPGEYLPVINPEVYQSWNPFFVIVLTPLVVAFFTIRARKGRPIPTAHKLLYGMLLTTGALLIMVLAGFVLENTGTKVSGLWLAGFYMVVTLGELCLSPMGLSLVTKLTPKRLVGLTMGGWFMATAFGNNFSGFFGGIQNQISPMWFFLVLAALAGLTALFIFLILPKLDRAIRKYGA